MEQMKKRCARCAIDKDESEFPIRKKRTIGICKECYLLYYGDPNMLDKIQREKAKRKKANKKAEKINVLTEVLTNASCKDCGLKDPAVLEFDHVNPEDKLFDVSSILENGSIPALRREMAKCEIVCANCHRRRTIKAQSHWRVKLLDYFKSKVS